MPGSRPWYIGGRPPPIPDHPSPEPRPTRAPDTAATPGSRRPRRSALRWGAVVAVLAASVYVNALSNGFARDDPTVVEGRELVREGRVAEAFRAPWWPGPEVPGAGLYRPLSLGSLAAQWRVFGGAPAGFHAVSALLHTAVSVGLFAFLLVFLPPAAAGAGATVFAVHPVHVEAVANVVGQAELLAALLVLACLGAYLRAGRLSPGPGRAAGWVAVGALYFLALLSKEGAVATPGLVLLVGAAEAARGPDEELRPRAAGPGPARTSSGSWARVRRRVLDELPLYALLASVLGAYLAVRVEVLGTVRGELVAPSLLGLGAAERICAALALWPEYLRLLLFPLDLAADYGPGVLYPATGVDAGVVAGALILGTLVAATIAGLGLRPGTGEDRRGAAVRPVTALGAGWLVMALLPVSHLFFPTGVLLAERMLYLPSVGLALVVSDAVRASDALSPGVRRGLLAAGAALVVALAARTVLRNPVWESTATVVASLEGDHPESHVVLRDRARRALEDGRIDDADSLYARALDLVPRHYGVLVEAAQVSAVRGDWPEAGARFDRAVALHPRAPGAYLRVARRLLDAGRTADARVVALQGIARAEPTAE
ncbi:MAG TPA: hypothetical protein VLL48_12280, partial [Longimicrobiales bacterium]|nr:hypothetical protein [Longimicrobiales bacterium]